MNEVIGYVDTRAAEVATTAIAADVAQVHQDMLDADADASAAAASAAAAAGTLANAVKKTGEASQSIAGDIAVAGDLSAGGDLAVTGDAGVQGQLSVLGGCDFNDEVKVRAPVNNTDAANKKYVDDQDASMKTYVDTQDATKISITDINNYAVGLTGNQTVGGVKTSTGHDVHKVATFEVPSTMPRQVGSGWVKMYETSDSNHINAIFSVQPRRSTSSPGFGIIACGGHNNGTIICKWLSKDLITAGYIDGIMVSIEGDLITVWAKNISATDTASMRMLSCSYNGDLLVTYNGFTEATDRTVYEMTESGGVIQGYTDSDNVTHVFNYYQISS